MFTVLQKREMRRKATHLFRSTLSNLGTWLPMQTKLRLARRSSKWGYLLGHDKEFIFPDYLGCFRVYIDAKYTSDRALLSGKYEEDLWWTVSQFVKPGDTCLDIGANVGTVSLYLAKTVGPQGKVICFEPGPIFFKRLNANLHLNPSILTVVESHNLGLSDKPGTLHWEEDPQFPGNAYLFGDRGERVTVTTIDQFFGEPLERLDFIKIDVEGMEFEVLSGARQTIKRLKPKIFFETAMDFETYRKSPIRKAAEDFLMELGYKLYRVDGNHLQDVQYPNFSQNTLALPS